MRELCVLSRLALLQHRWVLAVLIAAAACGPLIAVAIWVLRGIPLEDSFTVFGFLSLLPGGMTGVILFGFHQHTDLVSPESGMSHWLLRMPLRSWKLAIVPVILKTLWVSTFWMIFAVAVNARSDSSLPLITPVLCGSAAVIGLTAISWLPMRAGWHRVGLLVLLLAAVYVTLGLIFEGPHLRAAAWRPLAVAAGALLAVGLYGGSVWGAVRAVELARTAAWGIVRETAGRREMGAAASEASTGNRFGSPWRAMAWHEFARSRQWLVRSLLLGVLPASLVFGLIFPLHAASVIGAFIVFAYIAGLSVSGRGEAGGSAGGSALPIYLATSPLSTASIAWTRLLVPLGLVIGVFSCIVIVFALWALWPSNRQIWMQWAADQTAQLDVSAIAIAPSWSAMVTGVRLSIAITIAASTFLIGRIVAFWWIGMSGRTWFAIVATLVAILVVFVPLSLFLRWFMTQTQWSEVQAQFQQWLDLLPRFVAALVALKFAVALSLAVWLGRAELASFRSVAAIVALWSAVVVTIAAALTLLIPAASATLLACLGFSVLAVPLSRVLIMPIMLDWNRHR